MLYAANSVFIQREQTLFTHSTDNIFNNGYTQQLATLTPILQLGYNSYLEVTVQGTGTTGVGHIEKRNCKVLELKQNYPKPIQRFGLRLWLELKYLNNFIGNKGFARQKGKTVIEELGMQEVMWS